MGFKEALASASNSLNSVKHFIKQNHSISLDNKRLCRFESEIESLFKKKEIDEGKIELKKKRNYYFWKI